jgi:inosose dehydratase
MIKIANAPCSWGVLEFDLEGEAAGYEQVLDEIRETGYSGTELGDWGFMPTNPFLLKKEISTRNLELLGAFVPVALSDPSSHEKGAEVAVKTAKLMMNAGYSDAFIVLSDDNGKDPVRTQNAGRVKPEMGLKTSQWEIFASGANDIALKVRRETGLRTVFHHHCGGYVETYEEVKILMNLTDQAMLGLCLDTGHLKFGGGDPLKALLEFRNRIWHVHYKDCHPEIAEQSAESGWDYFTSVQNGVFCELGKGDIDFETITNELRMSDYHGWIVVEQDVLPGMGSPKDCALSNRKFLRSIGL